MLTEGLGFLTSYMCTLDVLCYLKFGIEKAKLHVLDSYDVDLLLICEVSTAVAQIFN